MSMRGLLAVIASASALSCGAVPVIDRPLPGDLQLLTRAEWGAKAPVLPMKAHFPVRITIHHTGVRQVAARTVAQKLRGLQDFSQREDSLASGRKKHAWADVPYHFYIGVDGTVGEGRDWRYAGDSNTPYNPSGHLLIVVEGNFEVEKLDPRQRAALDRIVPLFARHFGVPPDRLAAHRDFAKTSCPGADLYSYIPELKKLIAAR